MTNRRRVLGGLTVLAGLAAVLLLSEVVATVFFAMTVAYVLGPVRRRLRRRGLSRRLSAAVASLGAFLAVVALLVPFLVVLVVRLDRAIVFVESVPETVTVPVRGFEYTVVTADVTATITQGLIAAGRSVAAAAPVLLIKLSLFGFVVYGLLYHERRTRRAAIALVPPAHRKLAEALHERASRTLYGIYVVQAATGFATFLIAVPVFVAFGYPSPVVLATLAGVLQFIPVLGPSVLLFGLAGYHLALGDAPGAVGILLVGGTLIAAAPDLLIRPRLAAETAEISSTLYFIGFVGGVLTVGPIGVIAGPLAIAVVAELAARLSDELNAIRVHEQPPRDAADDGDGVLGSDVDDDGDWDIDDDGDWDIDDDGDGDVGDGDVDGGGEIPG